MTLAERLYTELTGQGVAPRSVTFEAADFGRHANDFTPSRPAATPLAVAYPGDTAEVAAVIRACAALGVPIVAQGGLTGMAGGGVPIDACLVLSLERMRGIEAIDADAATMTVLAGTPLEAAQAAADAVDMLFPLDLGARGSCTIGGNIATNAGGNRVLRYGMMRDLVLGLEVVLADGTIVTALNTMLKNNAGYDLKNLFIGSEGTLGVVTRAVLRLFPRPRTTNTALCALSGFDAVLALLKHARRALGPQLSAFEVMWQDFYTVATAPKGQPPLAAGAGSHFVLLDALGSNMEADGPLFQAMLEDAFGEGIIADAALAQSAADTAAFWSIRDSSGELPRVWGACVNFDVSVPIGRMEAFAASSRQRLARVIAADDVLIFGHVADSNLHLACRDPDGDRRHAIEVAVYDAVAEHGGSVSAEHGIGLDKRPYLARSRTPEEIALMRQVKAMLDPSGLLNPGKVLPDLEGVR